MRYLVFLDARSAIGAVYAHGNSDGYMTDGELQHHALDCVEVVTDAPYYLYAKRVLAESHQTLQIPHSSVVSIFYYADEGRRPIGFVPSSNTGREVA